MKLSCIICDVSLRNWDEAYEPHNVQVHPIGGTAFRTYGHYGSSVFDPMDATFLEIAICDDCLTQRMHHTYPGINKSYAAELEAQDKLMDQLINDLVDTPNSE